MTRKHIEKRYSQAQDAWRNLSNSMVPEWATPKEEAEILSSSLYLGWSRQKANQMTRITRRAVRMMATAS